MCTSTISPLVMINPVKFSPHENQQTGALKFGRRSGQRDNVPTAVKENGIAIGMAQSHCFNTQRKHMSQSQTSYHAHVYHTRPSRGLFVVNFRLHTARSKRGTTWKSHYILRHTFGDHAFGKEPLHITPKHIQNRNKSLHSSVSCAP